MAIRSASRQTIPYLVPDMPEYYQLARYLQSTDKQHWYSNFGPLVKQLEAGIVSEFFPDVAPERVVTCSSGTAALELAIKSLNLPQGATILVPSFTFPATVTAIINCGYTPIFSDVDPRSWQLTADIAYGAMGFAHVDAVLPVATMGLPQDIPRWEQFVRDTQLPVVIDAAPAIEHQAVSTLLTVCFSMHATKHFGIGEGGCVIYPSIDIAEQGRQLSNFGFSGGVIENVGSNYKLSEYHAAVGLAQLERRREVSLKREHIRRTYQNAIDKIKHHVFFQGLSDSGSDKDVSYLQRASFFGACVIGINDHGGALATRIIPALQALGIEARPWYTPAHQHPAFRHYATVGNHGESLLNITEKLSNALLSLPFHNFLTDEEIDYIVKGVTDVLKGSGVNNANVVRIG